MMLDTLVIQPLKEMASTVGSYIPTLLIGLAILAGGWIVSRFVRKTLTHLLTTIHFDKLAHEVGIARTLRIGGLKHKPAEVFSCIVYTVLMVMTLIMSVKALGFTIADELIGKIFSYVPSVVTGVVVLIIGMLLAKFVSVLVYITAKNTDMPAPETLRDVTKLVIVAYVGIIFLREIGFLTLFTDHYSLFIGGIIFALALSFGLAGKDVASKYLHVLDKK